MGFRATLNFRKFKVALISFVFLFRSFAPILRLISGCDSPAIHYWATWALANLCNVDRKFVCTSLLLKL